MCSILLVDYNSIDKTLDYIDICIDKIKYHKGYNFIINDNSPIHSLSKLEKKLGQFVVKLSESTGLQTYHFNYKGKDIIYCFANSNLGFAQGNNNCMRICEEFFHSKYYLISNNDISFKSNVNLNDLISIFQKNQRVAVVGPRVIGSDGKDQSPRKDISAFSSLVLTYWCAATYWLFKKVISGLDYDGTSKNCYWVVGCFMIVKADAMIKCGYFDEKTFLFAEEMILAERMKNQGYEIFFYDSVTVYHEESSLIDRSLSYLNKAQTMFDSKLYFYKKYKNINHFLEWFAKLNFSVLKFFYKIGRRFIKD